MVRVSGFAAVEVDKANGPALWLVDRETGASRSDLQVKAGWHGRFEEVAEWVN